MSTPSVSSPIIATAAVSNEPAPTAPRVRRGMVAHLIACAVGAGIDNLYRQVAITTMAVAARSAFPNDPTQAAHLASWNCNLALVLFTVPFVILAPLAGSLGDRLPKQRIIRAARIADVLICAFGIWGFAIDSPAIMLTALTLLATASTFFAPVKLAVVPELVDSVNLAKANAQLAAVTVIAILVGTCATVCIDPTLLKIILGWFGNGPHSLVSMPIEHAAVWSLAILSVIACLSGVIAAYRIPVLPAQAPQTPIGMPWNVLAQIRALNSEHGLLLPACALAGFWSLGGVAVIGLQPMAGFIYQLQPAGIVGLFLIIVLGICVGSALAPRYRSQPFPAGLPIFGAVLAGTSFLAAGLVALHDANLPAAQRTLTALLFCLFFTGVGGGLWEVAVTVLIQERSSAQRRNLIMSGVSVLASLGTILSAGLSMALVNASALTRGRIGDFNEAQTFVIIGTITVVSALTCAFIYRRQCAAWAMTVLLKLAYRVTVFGAENLPKSGGCLVVCNHLSYADGVILGSNLPRPGRFLVYRNFVDMPIFGFFLRAAGVIPVAAEDGRKALLASIDAAVTAAKAGEVVVIFPEGKISRSGQMDVFRAGLERIATRAGVPIVPAFLNGLWGSAASLAYRRSFPRPWRRVEMRIGAMLPPTTSAAEARDCVMNLSYQSAQLRCERDTRTLASAFITQARRHPCHIAIKDAGGQLSNAAALGISRAVIGQLALQDDEQRVGVILPPGRAGTLVNLALALCGRTAVNINHTCGPAQIQRMCTMAGIRSVISAGLYLRKIGLEEIPARVIKIEEVLPRLGKLAIVWHTICGLFLGVGRGAHAPHGDAVAAIIFSSGSTGDPKGVELTHRQILANCDCTEDGLDVHGGKDVLLSPLPLFHSFGLVPGMWLGLTKGMTVVAHPDPADGKALGELAAATGATFLISTPTFVRGYLRRIEPQQMKTMRFAVVGAERCPADLMVTFKERYGADLLEGYGCTELAPVVGVNLQDHIRGSVKEIRRKAGTIGRALPGLHVFAVDPDSSRMLPPGQEGLLVVRSPSRMRGYLDRPDLTAQAFIHGGYNTGDIGKVDDEGFVSITGRLARFAKVGGEMVPLDNVEAAVQKILTGLLGSDSTIEMAVSAVSDESRGERLIIMHTGYSGEWNAILDALTELPALWRPKLKDIRLVTAIPKLGTGKRDLSGIKKLAAQVTVTVTVATSSR